MDTPLLLTAAPEALGAVCSTCLRRLGKQAAPHVHTASRASHHTIRSFLTHLTVPQVPAFLRVGNKLCVS